MRRENDQSILYAFFNGKEKIINFKRISMLIEI